jgi:hypothetical protein
MKGGEENMRDLVPGGYTPTNVLAKQGVAAVGGIAGGVLLLVLGVIPFKIVGIAAGAVVGVIGLGAFFSKDPEDKKPGIITAAAGGLTILSRLGIFGKLAGGLLVLGTIGLFAVGIWNGLKFLRGLKSRS